MTNVFAEEMARLADIELIDIVTMRRADFLPDALAAADAEVICRGISIQQLEAYQTAHLLYHTRQIVEKVKPLPLKYIIPAFFLPFYSLPILYIPSVGGYQKRRREFILWNFCGCFFYALIAMAASYLFS